MCMCITQQAAACTLKLVQESGRVSDKYTPWGALVLETQPPVALIVPVEGLQYRCICDTKFMMQPLQNELWHGATNQRCNGCRGDKDCQGMIGVLCLPWW